MKSSARSSKNSEINDQICSLVSSDIDLQYNTITNINKLVTVAGRLSFGLYNFNRNTPSNLLSKRVKKQSIEGKANVGSHG